MMSGKTAPLLIITDAGVPLIEIVSEPDMRSADEVIAYPGKAEDDFAVSGGF